MIMSPIILSACTALLVLLTVLPLSRSTRWWIRDLDFPRLQIAIAGLCLLVAQTILLDGSTLAQAMLAGTAACVLYQGWWIVPYTRPYPNEVKTARSRPQSDRIRIMTANVLAPNRNAAALIALIEEYRPDVFVTLESDGWWQARLDTLQDRYPHAIKCPLDNLYGMHVYSALPLEDSAIRFLVQDDIPSMHTKAVLPSGRRILMHFLHPTPPAPTENDESAERDAELLMVARSVAGLTIPVIVAGDLNDVAWSATTRLFRKISGLLDPRVGRGMFNTFHADHWFMRWPLDHLFHSRHFTVSLIRRLPSFGSDHFPMLVELVHDVPAGASQKGLDATSADRAEANEKIAEETDGAASRRQGRHGQA